MKLYGEILILVLMLLSNGRVLTIRKPHLDPLVVLAPLSFLLSSLNLSAFGIDSFSIAIFVISFLVLVSNFHALIRYGSRLVIDRYSPLMKTWAWLTTILTLTVLITLLLFKPVDFRPRKSGVTNTVINYTGNFTRGFEPAEKFTICTGFLHEYSTNPERTYKPDVVLFMPDKRGDTVNYEPFLYQLSKAGYTILAGDFYTKDCKWLHTVEDSRIMRRLGLCIRGVSNPSKFLSQKEFYTFNFYREYKVMVELGKEKYGDDCKFFIVTDNMGLTAALDIQKDLPDQIKGVYDISSNPDYLTPGFGFIQVTNPLLARKLGFPKDSDLSSVSSCVESTSEAIRSVWLKK